VYLHTSGPQVWNCMAMRSGFVGKPLYMRVITSSPSLRDL